jgi:hypothetical protein
MAMLASKLERSARPLKEVAAVPMPPTLDAIVGKCLARKPNDRYSSATELLKVWRGLGKASVQPRIVSMPSQPSFPPGTQTALTANTIDLEEDGPVRARTGLMIIGGAATAAIAILTFIGLGIFGRTHIPANATHGADPSGISVAAGGTATAGQNGGHDVPQVAIAVSSSGSNLMAAPSASNGVATAPASSSASGGPSGTDVELDPPPKPTPSVGVPASHHNGGWTPPSSSTGTSSGSGRTPKPKPTQPHINENAPF